MPKHQFKIITLSRDGAIVKTFLLHFSFSAELLYNEKVRSKLYNVSLYKNGELVKSNFAK